MGFGLDSAVLDRKLDMLFLARGGKVKRRKLLFWEHGAETKMAVELGWSPRLVPGFFLRR